MTTALTEIHAHAIQAAAEAEAARIADPLTGPRPAHTWAGDPEPLFVETCNDLRWAPWTGVRPGDEHYPLATLDELPEDADGPATLAIDMRDLIGGEA